jgi:polyisoprenoid-binding protein YceI
MRMLRSSLAAVVPMLGLMLVAPGATRADTYKVDPAHSTGVFRIHHFNAGYIWGLIAGPTGTVEYDPDNPEKFSCDLSVPLANLDTHLQKRDDDLRGPDWFNAKQFPNITFKSTSVKKTDSGLDVTGDLTIHGVTKSVTIPFELTGIGKGMMGETRGGCETTFTINRSDYDMKAMPAGVGDEVRIVVAIEGVKQ